MAKVALHFESGQEIPRPHVLKSLAEAVAREEKLAGVNLVFCSNATIRNLNHRYRKLDRVTDVLSFPWNEPDFSGEVYVATDKAKSQCRRFNNSYFNELRRLTVHGLLHLSGYDHQKSKEREIMQKRENYHLRVRKNPKK